MDLRAVRRTTMLLCLLIISMPLMGWKCTGNPLVKPSFTGGPQSGHAPLFAQFQGDVEVLPPLVLAKFRGDPGDDEEPPPAPEPEPEPVTVVSWLWSFGDGSSGTGQNVSHVYTEEGCYDVTLTVVLSNGMSGIITRDDFICVEAGNRPPVANAGPDQEISVAPFLDKDRAVNGQFGTLVQLDGSGSYDPDDDSLTYSWSFLDWPEGYFPGGNKISAEPDLSDPTAESPTFEAVFPGEYVLQLIVDDGQAEDSKVLSQPDTVTITAVMNEPPVPDAGDDQYVCIFEETQLDGSGTYDPEGDDLTYEWSFVTVPVGSNVDDTWFSNAAARRPRFVPDEEGAYWLVLSVSDGASSRIDFVTVTVNLPGFSTTCVNSYDFVQGPNQAEIDGDVVQANELDPFYVEYLEGFEIGLHEVTNCLFTYVLNYANGEGYLDPPVKAFMGGNVTLNGEILLQIEDMPGEPEYCDIEWDAAHSIFFIARRDGQSMARHPVVEVSWFGALAFCNWLGDMIGDTDLMYDLSTWTPNGMGFDGYRLPDEAEWEYAAAWEEVGEGGRHHIWGYVSSLVLTDFSQNRVNCSNVNPLGLTSPPLTTPRGYYDGSNGTTNSQSPAGCYDMSGNVAEWVFEEPYPYQIEDKGTSLISRIVRGGSYADAMFDVRTARRDALPQDSTEPTVGFRVVRYSDDCTPQ